MALQYGCANNTNCTADEIAEKQWGQSLITDNPINADPVYTPKQNTCLNWGSYPVYGCEQALEYKYWALVSGNNESLSDAQVSKIQSGDINSYGLLNLYNSMKFMNAYFSGNETTMNQFNQYLNITPSENVT